jgi:hypothetical protein
MMNKDKLLDIVVKNSTLQPIDVIEVVRDAISEILTLEVDSFIGCCSRSSSQMVETAGPERVL